MVRLDAMHRSLADGGSVDPANLLSLSKALEKLEAATDNARRITEGLELSHRRRDEEVTANLGDILELTLKFIRTTLLKRTRLVVEAEPVPVVQGSPRELGQVLINLLINAMQAMPDRPRSESLVSVRLEPAQECEWVDLEISDNGQGIPAEVLERVFDPFFTTKDPGQGTGLGLSISHSIMEKLGGRLTFESQSGDGATFIVQIPKVLPGEAQ